MYTKNTGEKRFMNIPKGKRTTIDTKRMDGNPSLGSTSAPRSKRLKLANETNDYYTKGSGLPINASKVIKRESVVDGKPKKFSLIATQCPNQKTLDAFWDLVISSDRVDAVVALGDGLTDYWSKSSYENNLYDNCSFIVDVKSESKIHSADMRILEVYDKDTRTTKKVEHYHFEDWPDGTIPNNLDNFENFVKIFVKKRKLVVHCFAGVGRTGTFAACLDALKHGIIDPLKMVVEMRKYRTWMVQSPMQFDIVCKFIARNCLNLKKLGLPKPNWDDAFDYDKYFNSQTEYLVSTELNSSNKESSYALTLSKILVRLDGSKKNMLDNIVKYISENEYKFKEKFKNSLLFNTKIQSKCSELKKCKNIEEIKNFLNSIIE